MFNWLKSNVFRKVVSEAPLNMLGIMDTYYLFCTIALADPVLLMTSQINYKKNVRRSRVMDLPET
jgi:hypothetical protein